MTLLTVAEFQALSPSSLGEDALQLLLDAAEGEIVVYAGPGGAMLEFVGGGNRLITLARPAVSITSITETLWSTTQTLDATDYLLYPDGYTIERLPTGTNGRYRWWGRVAVSYLPIDDTDQRKVIQAELVKLDQNSAPGVTSEQIGSWMEQRASNSLWNASLERDAILSRLKLGVGMLVVDGSPMTIVGARW